MDLIRFALSKLYLGDRNEENMETTNPAQQNEAAQQAKPGLNIIQLLPAELRIDVYHNLIPCFDFYPHEMGGRGLLLTSKSINEEYTYECFRKIKRELEAIKQNFKKELNAELRIVLPTTLMGFSKGLEVHIPTSIFKDKKFKKLHSWMAFYCGFSPLLMLKVSKLNVMLYENIEGSLHDFGRHIIHFVMAFHYITMRLSNWKRFNGKEPSILKFPAHWWVKQIDFYYDRTYADPEHNENNIRFHVNSFDEGGKVFRIKHMKRWTCVQFWNVWTGIPDDRITARDKLCDTGIHAPTILAQLKAELKAQKPRKAKASTESPADAKM